MSESFKNWRVQQNICPGIIFNSSQLKVAGKKYRKDPCDAETYLRSLVDKGLATSEPPPNFGGPAKCNILDTSRDIAEWDLSVLNQRVQEYVYSRTKDEREGLRRFQNLDKASHLAFLDYAGIPRVGYDKKTGYFNHILTNAFNTYDGTILKVENRNAKAKSRNDRINAKRRSVGEPELPFESDSAFTETGHLKQPPSPNPILRNTNQSPPRPFELGDLAPTGFENYTIEPDSIVPRLADRMPNPQKMGDPGFIPRWQLPFLSKTKRKQRCPQRLRKDLAILGIINIGGERIVFDARGLLRNLRWRNALPASDPRHIDVGFSTLKVSDLFDYFTTDCTIDPQRGIVTFMPKTSSPGKVGVVSAKVIEKHHHKSRASALTALHESSAVVGVDLGVTNLMAVSYGTISHESETYAATESATKLFPGMKLESSDADKHSGMLKHEERVLFQELNKMYRDHDRLEAEFTSRVLESLTQEQRIELNIAQDPEIAKQRLLQEFGIPESVLDWEAMGQTTRIADYLESTGAESKIYCRLDKKSNPTKVKLTDGQFSRLDKVRSRASKSTRDAFNEALYTLKRASAEYGKLAIRKQQLCRRYVNYIRSQVFAITGQHKVIWCIEDLSVAEAKFSGHGRREKGWRAFFTPKREGRWIINVMHRTLSETAPHRGDVVLECNPKWTSRTGFECGHCSRDNRHGETFKCVVCGYEAHADLNAARNIIRACLTGTRLPGPPSEQSNDGQKPRTARNRKSLKSNESTDLGNEGVTDQAAEE